MSFSDHLPTAWMHCVSVIETVQLLERNQIMTHFFGSVCCWTIAIAISFCSFPVLVASSWKLRCFVNVTVHVLFPSPFLLSHTHTNRTEAGDAYPSADPTGIADTGLPFCYRLGGGREGESGKENKGQQKREGAVVVGSMTVFVDDLCWVDTFCRHAAFPQSWIEWRL